MRILGIDPGETTGVAIMDFPGRLLGHTAALSLDEVFDTMQWLYLDVDLIAIERFTISMRTIRATRQHDAMYVIGWVLGLGRKMGIPVQLQNPADAKSTFPDHVLEELELRTSTTHVRDATRHALLAARRCGHAIHSGV